MLGQDQITGLYLHDKQLEFVDSQAKRKVIIAGRRGGKTTGVSVLAARSLVAGRRVLYAAPTQEQTDQFWEYEKKYFWKDIKSGNIYKNETRRILVGQGRIRAKTAWDADTMRGDYADEMILEEYSMMSPSAWDEVGAPMLLDNDGNCTFIFTPKRKNHAHKLFLKASADDSGRWRVWHFTSHENPFLSSGALAEITEDMTEDAYKQEILAEFLDNEGTVFRNIAACMNAPKNAKPGQHRGHHIFSGYDWGQQNDSTAGCLLCADCNCEVFHFRFKKDEYPTQRAKIRQIEKRWTVFGGLAELNSIGRPNFEDLVRAGSPVSGFDMTSASKPQLIDNMRLALENAEIQWIKDPIWTGELESFEMTVNPQTHRVKYAAPSGMHDDTVIARALALRASETGRFTFA